MMNFFKKHWGWMILVLVTSWWVVDALILAYRATPDASQAPGIMALRLRETAGIVAVAAALCLLSVPGVGQWLKRHRGRFIKISLAGLVAFVFYTGATNPSAIDRAGQNAAQFIWEVKWWILAYLVFFGGLPLKV